MRISICTAKSGRCLWCPMKALVESSGYILSLSDCSGFCLVCFGLCWECVICQESPDLCLFLAMHCLSGWHEKTHQGCSRLISLFSYQQCLMESCLIPPNTLLFVVSHGELFNLSFCWFFFPVVYLFLWFSEPHPYLAIILPWSFTPAFFRLSYIYPVPQVC